MALVVPLTCVLFVPRYAVVETRLETARFTRHAGIGDVVVDLAEIAVAGKTEAEAWMGFLGFPRCNRVETF